jgi:CelD/BcsL family acetyltransferase involved in cellulose biosynthesis
MTVAVYQTFGALPKPVLDFIAAAAREDFFCGVPWMQTLIRTTSMVGDEVRIYVADKGDRPVAVLMTRERHGAGRLRMHMLLSPSHGMYTTVYGPVLDAGDGAYGLSEIAASIAATSPCFDALRFDSIEGASPGTEALVSALRAAGFLVQRFFNFENWCEEVAGLTIEEFLARRSKQTRYFIGRHVRRLARSGRGRFELVTDEARLEPALIAYTKVDRQSWKKPELHADCIPEMARAAAAEGVLRLGLIYVDDEPAAAQLWIVSGGRATIMRLHYAEKFGSLSVGTALTFEMMRHALEIDRVREIDFGRGDDDYKKKWVSQCRGRYGILAFNPKTAKGAAFAAWHFGSRVLTLGLRRIPLVPALHRA